MNDFSNNFSKKNFRFLLNERFYWTNDFTEREWFYRDIVQLENDQNR